MARFRSARTGRFVRKATGVRHPSTTLAVSGKSSKGGTRHRSAITGKFVSTATVKRHPDTTITENG
jgi:hypothetical protein